jgi:hypothetical protein
LSLKTCMERAHCSEANCGESEHLGWLSNEGQLVRLQL